MNIRPFAATTAALAAALLLHAPLASAQEDAPQPPPPPPAEAAPGAPGAPGAPSAPGNQNGGDRREQFRQRMNERLKSALKATDEEWSVIQPLLEKVQEKQREASANPFGGGGPGGPGGPGGGRRPEGANNNGGQPGGDPRREQRRGPGGSPESQALRSALENEGTSSTDIKAKLQALRDARKQATADLAVARENLKKVLNLRQEAIFVLAGFLE